MTASEKRKLLEAIEEVERVEGTDSSLTPSAIMRVLQARFSTLLAELNDAIQEAFLLQFIAARQSPALRARRPHPAQLALGLPQIGEVKIPVSIRIPPPLTRKGQPQKGRRGHWGKTLEVPLSDFALYLRRQAEIVKNASAKRRARLATLQSLYKAALAAAKGDTTMTLGEAMKRSKAKATDKAVRSLFD